jgi:lipid II:glycine glycyltransferase (peptidoglycan interpeptide bridge formation enzyme)
VQDFVPEKAELATCNAAPSFLQSAFWGRFKQLFGWTPYAFKVGPTGDTLLVITRPLLPGVSMAYVPWGACSAELARELRRFLPSSVAFIRFDPPWFTEGEGVAGPRLERPFKKAGADVQPPDTVLIDLDPPAEKIMAQMKAKWRYNIRLAKKHGVEVRRGGLETVPVFYTLFEETCKRDGIAMHSIDYYQTLFSLAAEEVQEGSRVETRVYVASHAGKDIAAIITLFYGPGAQATYLYGASSNQDRNLMAPYALQWQAMQDAKAWGCRSYDLFGIPPNNDPSHPMHGLYQFKTGFGGKLIHRPGSWDYACKPLATALFKAAEKARKHLRDSKKK